MGRYSNKSNKGSNYRLWRSTLEKGEDASDSRPQHRQRLRSLSWDLFSHQNIIADDHGMVPRKTRRAIALARFKKSWKANKPSAKVTK